MTALVSQALGSVLANFADAIEGGAAWRGSGTPYVGIPGQYSSDLRLLDDSPLMALAGASTTRFQDARTWRKDRWITQNGPAYWVVNSAGERRKITDYGSVRNTDAGAVAYVNASNGGNSVTTFGVYVTETVRGTYLGTTITLVVGAHTCVFTLGDSAGFMGDIAGAYVGTLVSGAPALIDTTSTTDWSLAGTWFTLSSGFSVAPSVGSHLTVLQGFKRVPNCIDIEQEQDGAAEGYDRYFHLSASAGKILEWSGAGTYTYETQLKLRLRLVKFDRLHDWTDALMTNLAILRAALTKREHYDGTYVRALFAVGGEPVVRKDDDVKIVAVDTYRLWYRLDTTLT